MANLQNKCLALLAMHTFLSTLVTCHQASIEGSKNHCAQQEEDSTEEIEYTFVPIPTIVAIVFVGFWFAFILIAKIMCSSSDQYKINNRFDLVIFKPGKILIT